MYMTVMDMNGEPFPAIVIDNIQHFYLSGVFKWLSDWTSNQEGFWFMPHSQAATVGVFNLQY